MADINPALSGLKYSLEDATSNLRAYVQTNIISGNPTEEGRVADYELYWQFYNGNHWRRFNRTMLTFNYIRAFIDKANQFLIGRKAFSLQINAYSSDSVDQNVEELAEKLLRYHWNKNNRLTISYSMMQMGSITGDMWCVLAWDDVKKYVTYTVLDSRNCFPMFEDGDPKVPTSFITRYPLGENKQKYKVKVTQYFSDRITTWYQRTTNVTSKEKDIYEFTQFDNPLRFIPVIHVQNNPNSAGYYGISDCEDLIKLNKIYNELSQELKSIIDYYTAPTTIVTGATIGNMTKKLGNVWSGLPPEANVYNLGLDVDLGAAQHFLESLKTSMHELGDIPENFLGKLQHISNTSAAALELTYQPIVKKADSKWIQYGEGIAEINYLTCKILRTYDSKNKILKELDNLSDSGLFEEDFKVEPVFAYGFPQDKQIELTIADQELRLRLNSRRRIMNRLGFHNTQELMQEIKDDIMEQAEIDKDVLAISTPQQDLSKGKSNNPMGINQTNTTGVEQPKINVTAKDFLK